MSRFFVLGILISVIFGGCSDDGKTGGGDNGDIDKKCKSGYSVCEEGGECVSLLSKENCGSCGNKCKEGEQCDGKKCVSKDVPNGDLCKEVVCNLGEECKEGVCQCGEGEHCKEGESCVSGQCLCGDEVCRGGICQQGACVCGEVTCKGESVCEDGQCLCGEVVCKKGERCESGECLCGESVCKDGERCVDDECFCGEMVCGEGSHCGEGQCVCDEGYFDCNEDMSDGCESSEQCKCKVKADMAWCYGKKDKLVYIPIGEEDKDLALEELQEKGKGKFSGGVHGQCKVGVAKCLDGFSYGECSGLLGPERKLTCEDDGKGIVDENGVDLRTQDFDCNGVSDGCVTACDLKVDPDSYIGCQYWTAYMGNVRPTNFTLVFSNANTETAKIKIFLKGTLYKSVDVSSNSVSELELFKGAENMVNAAGIQALGVQVLSTQPITVYQFNPMGHPQAYTNDASLLLPVNVLGRNYVSINYDQAGSSTKEVVVIATDNQSPTKIAYRTSDVSSSAAATEHSLKPFEVLNISKPSGKGSGLEILSDRPVAVLSGDRCLNTGVCCCDHIEEYMFPIKTWGTSYHMVRTKALGKELMYWSIVAAEDDTKLEFIGEQAPASNVLKARESLDLKVGGYFEVRSSDAKGGNARKPILVAMTMPSSHETGVGEALRGDPALMLMVPQEQYRKDYAFSVPSGYTKDWITIVAPMGSVIKLDDEVIKEELVGFGSKDEQGKFKFGYAYIEVKAGIHRLESDKEIAAYGNGVNRDVSYAYPLGLNLKNITEEKPLPPPIN